MAVCVNRSAYFDHVKLTLILLVVLGHTLSPLKGDSASVMTLWKWIYTFHMPLFIFMNGYFSSLKKPLLTRCAHLFLLYLTMQFLSACCLTLRTGQYALHPASPCFGLWYLLGLIFWTLALPLTEKIPARFLLPGSAALSLAAGYAGWIGPRLALSRALFFFPFFLLGFYAKRLDRSRVARFFRSPLWKIAGGLVLGLLALCLHRWGSRLPVEIFLAKAAYSARLLALPGPAFLYRLSFYAAACAAGGALLLLIPRRPCPFSALGKRTLAVYAGHLLLLDAVKDKIPALARFLPLPALVLLAVALALALCHPLFSRPWDWLMRLPLKPERTGSFPFLRPAPLGKRLRHWRRSGRPLRAK